MSLALALLSMALAAQEPWPRHTIDASSKGADGVRIGDVNRDGLIDIVTGWEEGGVVRAYLHPGIGRVRQTWSAITVGKVASPEDAVFVDLDGDGAMDVVSSCEGTKRSVFVHWSPRGPRSFLSPNAWTTEALPALAGRAQWMYAIPAQIDSRAGVDLVLGGKGEGASIGWLRAPAHPRDLAAWTFQPLRDASWVMSLRCEDLDQDGDLDILASDRKGAGRGVFWLENPGANLNGAPSSWPCHSIGAANQEVMFLDMADIDRDGRPDVVVAVKPRKVTLLLQPSDVRRPWLEHSVDLPDSTGTAKAFALADLDLDGKLDVAFSCEEARGSKIGLVWFKAESLLSGKISMLHAISGPEGKKFDRIELIDLDGDGDRDVLTTEEAENLGVIWYENPHRR